MAGDVPTTLPNTQPLTWDDDLADRMMDGLHRFIEQKIEQAVANRQQFWKRDTSSPNAYEKSIAPNRERLKKLIGVIDRRIASQFEVLFRAIRSWSRKMTMAEPCGRVGWSSMVSLAKACWLYPMSNLSQR